MGLYTAFRRAGFTDNMMTNLKRFTSNILNDIKDGVRVGGILGATSADSSALTNTVTETTLATVAIPSAISGALAVGDVINIKGYVNVTAANSTNTLQLKLKMGGVVVMDFSAIDVAADDFVNFDITLVVKTIGASGAVVGLFHLNGLLGAVLDGPSSGDIGSATIDFTAATNITLTGTWSVADAGNSCYAGPFIGRLN